MNPYLQVDNISKSLSDRVLFRDVSFGIAEGQRVALVARNGTGKTTLLNILTGKMSADSGTVTFRRDLRVGYLSQQPRFDADMTVMEACMQHAPAETDWQREWDYETRYKQILGKLNITDLQQKIHTLSGGQLKRVALAAVLIQDPELLILDEPTNHLDLAMVEWLEDFLCRSTMAILMVTHDRYFLDNVCSDILELDNQQLYVYHGNYSYYLEKRAERIEVFNAETEKMRNLYRYELDWMRRMPQARGHKSRGRIDNFYRLEDRVHQSMSDDSIRLDDQFVYIGSKIFEAKHVSKSFCREAANPAMTGDATVILDDFNYVFSRYEKMGIIGNNGTGKTTFLRLLLGEVPADSGVFDIGETVRFGYYSQQGLAIPAGKKVIEVVEDSALLQQFLFSPSRQYDYVEKLSGGERQRLNLCRVLATHPNFLILDEPTNDLDIPTLNVLEAYLRNFGGCLIVVSHDRYFMDKVVDHLLVFQGGGKINDFPGNYTQYREWKQDQDKTDRSKSDKPDKLSANSSQTANTNPQTGEKKRKLSFKEQQELRAIEQEMTDLESEKSTLEQALSGGATAADEITRISARYQQVCERLDTIELRWLELSEI